MAIEMEEIRHRKLYKQSGAAIGCAIALPFAAVTTLVDYGGGLKTSYPDDILYISPDYQFFHYFSKEKCWPTVQALFKRIEANPDWMASRTRKMTEAFDGFERVGEDFLALANDYPHSGERLKNALKTFLEKDAAYWVPSILVDYFDPFETEILDFVFGSQHKVISPSDLQTLLLPPRSVLWEEKKDFLAIQKWAIKNKAELGHEKLDALLDAHARKYYWIQNDYQTVRKLTSKDFQTRLGEKETPFQWEKLAREKETLIQKYGLDSGTQNRLNQFCEMAYLRDLRKKYTQIANYYIITGFRTLAKKMNMSEKLADFVISFAEYEKFLANDPTFRKELELRKKNGVCVISYLDGRPPSIETTHARVIFDVVEHHLQGGSIVYGNSASLGKGIGTARIVLRQEDFGKFRDGDVLITGMTRPEYVPLMKRAVAIVTDEGGITCHAAIVSRELGKPCVIGTQVATKSFEDGERVEVNANHGYVKKIGTEKRERERK
jgi:phosphohistidine swiveling domain-containing protein